MLRLRILEGLCPALYVMPESTACYEKGLLKTFGEPGGFYNLILRPLFSSGA